ncbi:MAG: hypothetical protein BAJALOKI3v1_850016 [Promethearchaeota archaeon]|nr:MAG: hypothetical protein BAJALOKI3v1_850016 [Candidatus Lokiarchaeota archaeon]
MSKGTGVASIAIILAIAGIGLGAYTIFFQIPDIDPGNIFGRAELRSNQNILGSGTYVAALSSDGMDHNGIDWDSNEHFFTIITPGKYLICISITFRPDTIIQSCVGFLRLNSDKEPLKCYIYINRAYTGTAQTSDMITLKAGDQLRLMGTMQGQGIISGDAEGSLTFLSIQLVQKT